MKLLRKRLNNTITIKPSSLHRLPKLDHLKPPKANQNLNNYVKAHQPIKALSLFRELLRKSVSTIDSFSLLFVLKACTQKSSIIEAQSSHCIVFKLGFNHVVQIQTSLIKMYSSTSNLVEARKMFDEMSDRNVVSWTALISAYVENRKPNEALRLFRRMQIEKVEPDRVTITVAIAACADLGALATGEWISGYLRRKPGLGADLPLNNALIDMYAKCGESSAARRIFDAMPRKDVASWTAMIVGHALNGQANEALALFDDMKESKNLIAPNEATFLGVLTACSHAGFVDEGMKYFRSMVDDFALAPREEHFGCIVDMLCRAGRVNEAREFVDRVPVSRIGAVTWRILLGGGDLGITAEAERRLGEFEPGRAGDDVAVSNFYAARGVWERKEQRRSERRSPGCSSVEVGDLGVSEFVASDCDHPFRVEICGVLKSLLVNMKDYDCGYFCHTSWLHDSQ